MGLGRELNTQEPEHQRNTQVTLDVQFEKVREGGGRINKCFWHLGRIILG